MRIMQIDATPILPMLSASSSDFALWVRLSVFDIPTALHVTSNANNLVSIRFAYPDDDQGVCQCRACGGVLMYCSHNTNRIAGFDVPSRRFHKELRDLIVWLRERQRKINIEGVRNNHRLVAALLQTKAELLFSPPQ